MKFLLQLWLCLTHLSAFSFAQPSFDLNDVISSRQADPTKVGYLSVYWKTGINGVFFALSKNDSPFSFVDLNNGTPIVAPTVGQKFIRDVSIVPGGGREGQSKWYMIGTDLNIGKVSWNTAVRNGSRGIITWESNDLLNWTNERLVQVENSTAGMVWAPDAIWVPHKRKYFVHWASNFYNLSDTAHAGTPTTSLMIRGAFTSDFTTYGAPFTYIDNGSSDTLDLAFLPVNQSTIIRFIVGGGLDGPVPEVSHNGLWGDWERPAGSVIAHYEGPYAFWDNAVDGKALLMCDLVGSSAQVGLRQWTSADPESGRFVADTTADNKRMRHGSVLPLNQQQYDRLAALL